MVEKVHTCGRLHSMEHGVRATIKEIKSSLLPGKYKVAHYHRGRRCLWAGEHYLQQRLSFSNLLRMSVLQTCSRNIGTLVKGEFWVIRELQHSHYLFSLGPSAGFLWITVRAFHATEVIVDCSPLSASIIIPTSHGTWRREGADCHLFLH